MLGFCVATAVCRPATRLAGLQMAALLLLPIFAAGPLTTRCFANDQKTSQRPDAPAVQAEVRKIGVGKDVKVTLIGGQRLRGHVSSIAANSFSIRTHRQGSETQIPYDQVEQVKDPSAVTWFLLGAAVVIIVIIIVH
jgi:hypothetical protein